MNLLKIIQNKEKNKNHFMWNGIQVLVKDPIINPDVSIQNVLAEIDHKVPKHFIQNVDVIYVGKFDFLEDRNIQAVYEDSCIYVTNDQSSLDDMCDDIVHEIAHSVEDIYLNMIYSDQKIEKEFLQKRKKLFSLLKGEGYQVSLQDFLTLSYKKEFDEFLYKDVGYSPLDVMAANIFYSPYAATSIREYFANGFEAYFYFGDGGFLRSHCPHLYEKLTDLEEIAYDT